MFLLFERFQPQNVLILFLFSITHSYLLTDMERFNSTLEEKKVIYPDGKDQLITSKNMTLTVFRSLFCK